MSKFSFVILEVYSIKALVKIKPCLLSKEICIYVLIFLRVVI